MSNYNSKSPSFTFLLLSSSRSCKTKQLWGWEVVVTWVSFFLTASPQEAENKWSWLYGRRRIIGNARFYLCSPLPHSEKRQVRWMRQNCPIAKQAAALLVLSVFSASVFRRFGGWERRGPVDRLQLQWHATHNESQMNYLPEVGSKPTKINVFIFPCPAWVVLQANLGQALERSRSAFVCFDEKVCPFTAGGIDRDSIDDFRPNVLILLFLNIPCPYASESNTIYRQDV